MPMKISEQSHAAIASCVKEAVARYGAKEKNSMICSQQKYLFEVPELNFLENI